MGRALALVSAGDEKHGCAVSGSCSDGTNGDPGCCCLGARRRGVLGAGVEEAVAALLSGSAGCGLGAAVAGSRDGAAFDHLISGD